MAVLSISGITKVFRGGTTAAVSDVSLEVGDGELVCLLGPSGSGKSTLLRMAGGFETPTVGTISIDGEDVTRLPPERRPTGMVFQSHALWTHMNVFRNVAFGLRLRRLPSAEIRERVEAVLALVGLSGYGNRHVSQLSGGQQQRVALARSLVLEPKILLLDEPFASLDQHLRERLREEVREIQQRLGITTLFVTHGQDEALSLADRIVVMRDGRTEQIGAPDVIYRDPATPFVAGFIGTMNLIEGVVADGRFVHAGLTVDVPVADGPATLAIRPEALTLRASEPGEATVHRVIDYGSHGMVDLDLRDGLRIKAMIPDPDRFCAGQGVDLMPERVTLYRDNRRVFRS
jgi:putative spermidine/putrescine transport system ATP-binding protein